jgi:hypothetical protein
VRLASNGTGTELPKVAARTGTFPMLCHLGKLELMRRYPASSKSLGTAYTVGVSLTHTYSLDTVLLLKIMVSINLSN